MTLESIDILKYKLYIGLIHNLDPLFSYTSDYVIMTSSKVRIEKQCSLGTPHLVPLKLPLVFNVLFEFVLGSK